MSDIPHLGEARVVQVDGDDSFAIRLRELGFCPDTRVQFVREAPLGGPLVLRLRGYELCLRRAEARRVVIAATD